MKRMRILRRFLRRQSRAELYFMLLTRDAPPPPVNMTKRAMRRRILTTRSGLDELMKEYLIWLALDGDFGAGSLIDISSLLPG